MNTSNYMPTGVASAANSIATKYNKNPDAELIVIENSQMDAIVEYFKDHEIYQYCADLTMDGQLKFKEKPVIAYIGKPVDSKTTKGSTTHDEIKKMINKLYGYDASKYTREAANV